MYPQGREIVLGVAGGISAYKSCELLRRLQDVGCQVTVVPTRASLNFVGVSTWEALSGRPVPVDLWNNVHQVPHIALAKKADLLVIAPATADLMAKVAAGIADDLLTNILLASDVPTIFVPAMHSEMWRNAATQAKVLTLRARGYVILEPATGKLTSGDTGIGRYPELAVILASVAQALDIKTDLKGRSVLISAGGTREAIDPVRYIGNHSTGKQGYALAQAAMSRGATVTLVAANSALRDIEGLWLARGDGRARRRAPDRGARSGSACTLDVVRAPAAPDRHQLWSQPFRGDPQGSARPRARMGGAQPCAVLALGRTRAGVARGEERPAPRRLVACLDLRSLLGLRAGQLRFNCGRHRDAAAA